MHVFRNAFVNVKDKIVFNQIGNIDTDILKQATVEYEKYFLQHGNNFLMDFYEELQNNPILFAYFTVVLLSIQLTKVNNTQAMLTGIIMTFCLMNAVIEDKSTSQFTKFTKPSLN